MSTAARARGWQPTRGVAVDLPEIDRTARPAAWAVDIKPRRARDQRCPYRRRPQHVAAYRQLLVPALNDGFRLGAHGLVRSALLGADLDVEPSRTNPHGGSIGQLSRLSRPCA